MKPYLWAMEKALTLANQAYGKGEVPVGCLILDDAGKVVSEAFNLKEENQLVFHHAEILALQKASEKINNWRIEGHSLVVTLEPCPMCLSAIVQARFRRLIFGAYDPKAGAYSQGHFKVRDPRLNHQLEVMGGILHYPCSKILSQFFRERR